jgi:hypothetical protein
MDVRHFEMHGRSDTVFSNLSGNDIEEEIDDDKTSGYAIM